MARRDWAGGLASGLDLWSTKSSGCRISLMPDVEGQISLFNLLASELPAIGGQLTQEQILERQSLLADIAESRLGTMQQRLAYLLHRFPETRDSDVALAIKYWRMFQPEILEQWSPLELEVLYPLDRMDTIARMRRHIQNDLKLFASTLDVRRQRDGIQMEMHQLLAAARTGLAEIRFYLDETGGEAKFNGIGGICAMNWRQYEANWASLRRWRERQKWPGTIHFAETGTEAQPRAMALLAELQKRIGGLLFLGYALESRTFLHQDRVSLIIQLVVDALRELDRHGCLRESRSLLLVKEEESGFDNLHMEALKTHLSRQLFEAFGDRVLLREIQAIPKGREVMLECADLIASAMMRRHLYQGTKPKDVLAQAVFNVTGFGDPRDNGALFRTYPAIL
jgi:hypothetical protein